MRSRLSALIRCPSSGAMSNFARSSTVVVISEAVFPPLRCMKPSPRSSLRAAIASLRHEQHIIETSEVDGRIRVDDLVLHRHVLVALPLVRTRQLAELRRAGTHEPGHGAIHAGPVEDPVL